MIDENKVKIVSLNPKNISEYKPVCFLNPKNEGFWKKGLKKRYFNKLKL